MGNNLLVVRGSMTKRMTIGAAGQHTTLFYGTWALSWIFGSASIYLCLRAVACLEASPCQATTGGDLKPLNTFWHTCFE